jgi:ATP-dependent DNA helicase PIF1
VPAFFFIKNRFHLKAPIKLTHPFKQTLLEMENGFSSLFITGNAGTGKSTLLEYFRRTTQKKVVVLAPTGVAALHVRGQTVHSFFGIPPRLVRSEELQIQHYRSKLFRSLDIIVVDEASMLRADLLDHMNYMLKKYRKRNEPFGGVKLILVGDLYQLPPVVAQEEKPYFNNIYETPYFFSAKCFNEVHSFHIIELKEIFRQSDPVFIDLLRKIRFNEMDQESLNELNARVNMTYEPGSDEITLTATNASADTINTSQLNKLKGQTQIFPGKLEGAFNKSIFPADQLLHVKEGAQVMLLRNDPEWLYANGTLGIVTSCEEDYLEINIKNNEGEEILVEVERETWEMIRYIYSPENNGELKYETIGSYTQFPIKLAWAITIHKSQGKTFDKVMIDLGRGAFEFGQTYVALSRSRTLEGITLKQKLKASDIQSDDRILDFFRKYI